MDEVGRAIEDNDEMGADEQAGADYTPARRAIDPMAGAVARVTASYSARRAMPDPSSQLYTS